VRILIHGINFHPEAAGVGKYTGEMANWLAAAGHEVRVVTAPPHFPQWRISRGYRAWRYDWQQLPSQAKEMEVCRCPTWVPKSPNGLRRLVHLASFALSSLPVLLWQTRWHPDVVLVIEPTFLCAPQALLAARLSRSKAWLHIQDFEVDAAFELGDLASPTVRNLALTLERWLLRKFDRVSAISEQMIGRLKTKGVDSSRCVYFPNWVDTSAIYPLSNPSSFRRELGIAEDAVVALYSGSMGKKQGLDLLVDAARRLSKCSDLQFVFCGEGSYRQIFAEKSKGLQKVIILPFQPSERLNDLLNLADIHLLPQRADAADLVMPSKLTGMLASGRPVLATAQEGTQLASAMRGLGRIVPPGDLDAFVSALVELAGNRDLRLRLGQEARRYALTHLDSLVILDQFEQSLLAVCGISGAHSKDEQAQGSVNETLPRDLRANFVEPPSTLGVSNTRNRCI
jgi:colanic acid biosynthesis glycosyl transferase WcaI